MANPRALTLLTLAATLLALGGFVSFQTVFAAEVGVVSYPGDPKEFLLDATDPAAPPTTEVAELPVVARVELDLRPRARLVANGTPSVVVVRGFGRRKERVGQGEFVAGSAALPLLPRNEHRGAQLAKVPIAGAERYRVVRLADASDVVEVRMIDPATYRGRVVDQGSRGVAGARIWLGGIDGGVTDAEGVFAVAGVRSAEGLPLVVRAPGFADYFAEVGIPDRDVPQLHVLDRGIEVRVQLAAQLPADASSRPRIHLAPASAGYVPFPWFWSALPVGAAERTVDERGSCRVRWLPRNRALRVVVHHPHLATEVVQCTPRRDGEVIVVRGRVTSQWRGRVAASGTAGPRAWVVAQASRSAPLIEQRQALGLLVPPMVFVARQGATLCGADGSFSLGIRQERRGQTLYLRAARAGCMSAVLAAKGHVGGQGVEFVLPPDPDFADGSGAALELDAMALASWAGIESEGRMLFRSEAGSWGALPQRVRLAGNALVDLRLTCTPEGDGAKKVFERKGLAVVGSVALGALFSTH